MTAIDIAKNIAASPTAYARSFIASEVIERHLIIRLSDTGCNTAESPLYANSDTHSLISGIAHMIISTTNEMPIVNTHFIH